ncbi:Phytanoyl-CoA hydroxylase-interacting [Aphelenchoides bicaudatus]|nr:Phytanoyl-CoA hydroxylase-interacting [Aphelenchoides bicaudatus]
MTSPKPPSWFDATEFNNIRPPVYVPDVPAPEWVRNSIGSRQITPSASLFSGGECLNDEVEENGNRGQGSATDILALALNNFNLKDDGNNGNLINEQPFVVDVKVLSTLCHVKWTVAAKYIRGHKISIHLLSGGQPVEQKDMTVSAPFYEFNLMPGHRYQIKVQLIRREKEEVSETFVHNFRSVFSQIELDALYILAKKFVDGRPLQMIKVLYRVKPKRYFEDINRNFNSRMIPYLKDNSGHPASPINRKLKGLFFLGSTQNGALPETSPFGDMRFSVPVFDILNPLHTNVYFTDFYCSSRKHYVTVVVCKKDSEPDRFCAENTKLLDLSTNPFLRILKSTKGPEYMVFVNNYVHVEICYTEEVDLANGQLKSIQPFGSGTSVFGGLSNNKACPRCNLVTAKKT